jgi:hypothetical protein
VAELSSELVGSMRAGSWAVPSSGRSRRGLQEAIGAAAEQAHIGEAWDRQEFSPASARRRRLSASIPARIGRLEAGNRSGESRGGE